MFGELLRRRVPQILGIYLGITWALLEFSDWVVQRYLLSDSLVDIVFVTMAAMLPTVLMLAWFHGARGRDHWARTEKIGIPVNVLATVALIWAVFHGEELGAAAENVEITDETGKTIQRVVPKESMRRHMVFFFLDDDNATTPHWLQYGLPFMVADDLSQDPFIESTSPYGFWGFGMYWQLRRRGFDDGLNVPVTLAREVADDFSQQYFVTGSVTLGEPGFGATMVLYSVDPAREVGRVQASADNPFALADQLAAGLKPYLDVQSLGGKVADDLPVSEHFTDSEVAARGFFSAMNEMMLRNDWAAAKAQWLATVEHNPHFADAWYYSGFQAFDEGEVEMATRHVQEALRYSYKLDDEQQFYAKGAGYSLNEETDKQVALAKMWAQLYPHSAKPHIYMANIYQWNGNKLEEAIEAYARANEREPGQIWILSNIARLEFNIGNYQAALEGFEEVMAQRPEDASIRVSAAKALMLMGDLDKARAYLEEASLLEPDLVSPLLNLADVAMREGRVEEASTVLRQAQSVAVSEHQKALVIRKQITLLKQSGRLVEARALLPELEQLSAKFQDGIDLLAGTLLNYMDLLATVDGPDAAMQRIETLTQHLEPPMDRFKVLGRPDVFLAAGDWEKAEQAAYEFQQALIRFDRPDMAYMALNQLGQAQEGRGDFSMAAQTYAEAVANLTSSVQLYTTLSFLPDLRAAKVRAERLAGYLDAARDSLEMLEHTAPGNAEGNLQRAYLALEDGDPTTAREALNVALKWWQSADESYEPARQARALDATLPAQ